MGVGSSGAGGDVSAFYTRDQNKFCGTSALEPTTARKGRMDLASRITAERPVPSVICHARRQPLPPLDQLGARRVALRLRGAIRCHQRQHVRPSWLYFTLEVLSPLGEEVDHVRVPVSQSEC
jgi:hypothetical protein